VPANYFLKQLGPSKWFALLMICWGAISMGMGGIKNFAGLTATRFLLGVFEAGLAPGLAYYTTFWYRANERSIRLALFIRPRHSLALWWSSRLWHLSSQQCWQSRGMAMA